MTQQLTDLVRQTAQQLSARHVGVAVGAISGDDDATWGAGQTERGGATTPGADTRFEIGSVTKVFTALALAQRASCGAVDLDQPVRQLLPDGTAVPSRGGAEITLAHLATHTSGLPRLPKGLLRRALTLPAPTDPYADCTPEFIYAGLGSTRLRATPGQRFRYSNLGCGLLGMALAAQAGSGYETLVTEQVTGPLGLTRSDFTDHDLAQGHTRRAKPTSLWHLNALAGAGALRSTVSDLLIMLRAQLDGGPGDLAAALRLTRQVRHPVTPFTWTHLGWHGLRLHRRFGSAEQIWHNGGTGGFRSWVGFIPEKRAGVVVLSNTARSVDGAAFDLLRVTAFGGELRRP